MRETFNMRTRKLWFPLSYEGMEPNLTRACCLFKSPMEAAMPALIMWLAGVPLAVIVLLYLIF